MSRKLKKYILGIALIFTTLLIFHFSSQPGDISSHTSSAVRDFLQHTLEWIWPGSASAGIFDFFWTYIRKFAHFMIYMILGVFALLTADSWLNWHAWKQMLISLAFCAFYAGTDEFHQLFVPGRAGMFRDVLLDTAGAAVGIAIVALCLSVHRHRKRRKMSAVPN